MERGIVSPRTGLAIAWLALVLHAEDRPFYGAFHVGAYSTRQSEIGFLLGQQGLRDSDMEERFSAYLNEGEIYSNARTFTFLIAHDGDFRPRNVSYEALLPGLFLLAGAFTLPGGHIPRIEDHLFSLLNGEVGVRRNKLALGFVNGVHPFFGRRWYQDAGVRISYGDLREVGLYFYEQNRFSYDSFRFGVRMDLQTHI